MKRILLILSVLFILGMSGFTARAGTYEDFFKDNNADEVLNTLPNNAKSTLKDIGIESFDLNNLNKLSFKSVFSAILNNASSQSKTPFKTFSAIIAVLLLYSVLYGVKTTLEGALQPVLSLSVTLCISCALLIPLSSFITSVVDVIKISSDFMIAYVPLMVLAMGLSGQPVSGSAYYAVMIFTGQAVGNISSKVIAPFMKIFLAVSISSAISPNVNLSGIVRFISKYTKVLLVFSMSIFTGVLSIKQVVSQGADSISSRAVRLSLSSFVPIVGSALSEAYRTVQGSVGLLKSGIGLVSLIALAAVYMPVILQCLFWMVSLGFAKCIGEVLNLREPCVLLESVYSVVSTLLAIILSFSLIFIISTSLILLLGGGA